MTPKESGELWRSICSRIQSDKQLKSRELNVNSLLKDRFQEGNCRLLASSILVTVLGDYRGPVGSLLWGSDLAMTKASSPSL